MTGDADDKTLLLPDGRRLGYAEYGDTAGKPVVYCHGGLSSRLDISWCQQQCKQLAVRLLAIDRPGIGLSDRQPNRTLLDWGEDVRAFAETLSIEKFAVLGWSNGAPYALACAAAMPEQVTAAGVVAGIGPLDAQTISELGMFVDRLLFSQADKHPKLLAALVAGMRCLPPPAVRQMLLSEIKMQSDVEAVQALSLEESTHFFFEALRQGGEGIVDDYAAIVKPWGFEIKDLQPPLLVWQGEGDLLVPPATGARHFANSPPVQFFSVPRLGHFMLHETLSAVLGKLLHT